MSMKPCLLLPLLLPLLLFLLIVEKSQRDSMVLSLRDGNKKMLFYLTTLNLAKFLYENAPKLKENETDRQVVAAMEAWKHVDFLYKNYILNGLDNTLYRVYSSIKTAKELWDSLEKKYKTEDAGTKKFIVRKLLNYKWWIPRLCSVKCKSYR